MPGDQEALELLFIARYQSDKDLIDALHGTGLEGSAKKELALVDRIAEQGLAKVLLKRPKSSEKVLKLVADFVEFGPMSVLATGSQRGGDFLNNQLRGRWAEQVVISMKIPKMTIIPYGPSGAAMPGEESHHRIVATFGLIHRVEGKRPDLLAFGTDFWEALDGAQKHRASTWPERPLAAEDLEILAKAEFAIEVKSSTWHYMRRRAAGGKRLSITVKDEELEALSVWAKKTQVPVLFMQVLFDEIYCMSYIRMLEGKNRGFVYEEGDYKLELERKSNKYVHKFFVDGPPHKSGDVAFPDESTAEIRILEDGSVVPYINLAPAMATSTDDSVVLREARYTS